MVPEDEEIFILSPYTVLTKQDKGFRAATAQAGGRLVTEIKDTPVAYSVINQEFIQALGITDLTQAADWTTGSFRFPDGSGGGDLFNITVPVAVRGILGNNPLRQRNFFPYYSENDSFNIERYDFGRGPNQVLFGNGTIGGTQTTMTKRPDYHRTFSSLELTYGSWDNRRAVLDVNHPILENLAARTALMMADRNGWRDGEMEKREAAFLTVAYKPFKNTEIRTEGEVGRIKRRIPTTQLFDRLAGWNGATVASGRTASNNAAGVRSRDNNWVVYNPLYDSSAAYDLSGWLETMGAGQENGTRIGDGITRGSQNTNTSGATILDALSVPSTRFNTALANSNFRIPDRKFTMAPDAPLVNSKFQDLQLAVTQRVGSDLFFELAGDANRVDNDINRIEGDVRNTFVDINPTLPGGAPNPNLGKVYGDGRYTYTQAVFETRSIRAAGAYTLDLNKWGRYSFNVMGGMTNQLISRRNRILSSGAPVWINNTTTSNDPRLWASDANPSNVLRQRFYWGDSRPYSPPTGPLTFINTNGVSTTVNPRWVPWVGGNDSTNNFNDNENDYNYILGAMIAKYLDGRVIVTAAYRYDDSQQQVRYLKRIGDFPSDWDMNTPYWRPDAPADWLSLPVTRPRTTVNGVAVNNPSNPVGARYADDYNSPSIKASVWTPSVGAVVYVIKDRVSVFGNYAEAISFNTAAAPDVYGKLLPVVEGKGYDVGMRFDLFKGKVNISASYYENEEFGNYVDPTSVTNQINGLYNANLYGDTTTGGTNQRGAVNINGLVRDTRTRIASGYEFELVMNVTDNWRVTASYALPKVVEKEYAPFTRQYVEKNRDLFIQILQDAGGELNANGRAQLRAGVPANGTEATGNEATAAVNAYNNLFANAAGFVVGEREATNAPDLAKVFTDYTFATGFLKNVKVGLGVNWRGERVVGYRNADLIADPSNPTVAIDDPAVDGYTTIKAPGATLVTATLGYRWPLQNGRSLNFEFRVFNVLGEDDLIWTDGGITARPKNGDYSSPARESVYTGYDYQTPRNYSLSVRLNF